MVVHATMLTAEVRMPVIIIGIERGICILKSTILGSMPMPAAASVIWGSTFLTPRQVLTMIGGDLTPDNPLYGLYLFKKGFSGELTEFCGEFEMVYKPAVDLLLNKGLSAARSVRRKLIVGKKRREAQATAQPAARAETQQSRAAAEAEAAKENKEEKE